jgi:GTPase SAR1 family protein
MGELEGFVTFAEGQAVSEEIGARAYFECSAKEGRGVAVIFQEAGRTALKYRRRSSAFRSMFAPKSPRASTVRGSKTASGIF